MEFNSFDLYNILTDLVHRKLYSELEQLVIANKHIITIPMLNELFELPLYESVVKAHQNLYKVIVEAAELNQGQLTIRHTFQLASIKLAIEKLK